MYELNQEVKRLLKRMIREVVEKGDISPTEIDCVKDAYEVLYYMQATETMDEYGDSYDSVNMRVRDDMSMRRGRGADGRFKSMTSYHSVNDRIIATLERELDNAESEFERNKIMDEIRSTISPEMKLQMELSVAIANRIYEILEEKGMSQKDFAQLMGKTETEVSRWLSGTHNLTLSTICKISAALGEDIVRVPVPAYEFEPVVAADPLLEPVP